MFYSKSTGGFYTTEIHGDNIPADAVEITVDQHSALLQAQSEGLIISADESGNPIAAPAPPPTKEQVNEKRIADIKAELLDIDFKSMRPIREGDTVRVAEFNARAQFLRDELKAL